MATIEIAVKRFYTTADGIDVTPSAGVTITTDKLSDAAEIGRMIAGLCEALGKTVADMPMLETLGKLRDMTPDEIREYRDNEAREGE
jgi:hypothetical protein